MKCLFSMLFAAVMAFSLQAVTVAWTLQNSAYIATDTTNRVTNWTGQTATSGATLNVYVVFSATDFSQTEKYVGAAEAVRAAINNDGTVRDENANVVMATKDFDTEAGWDTTKTSKLNVTASFDGAAAGYYYMVVFEGNNTNGAYAVAQTSYLKNGVDTDQGVYSNVVGTEPTAADFVELNWVGGTWDAPRAVPEPTALALLALGVAGLALRRKNA